MNRYQQHAKGGLYLLTLSFALIAGGFLYLLLAHTVQAASIGVLAPEPQPNAIVAIQPISSVPVHLSVSRVNVELPVVAGVFDQAIGQWNIDNTHAFFAEGTLTPILYGHNQPSLFAPLADVTKGDIATVTYQDGASARFMYDKTRFVSPNDASILTENNPRSIILLTCSGLFNESRRVVYFKEVS